MSFLGEIRRRKVFQVATVYAVVAWLLVQIVATVEVPLSLPDWFDTVAIVSLAIGFPIAVILAWAFDLTPEGIRSESSSHGRSERVAARAGGPWPNYVLQGLVLIAVGFLVIDQYVREPSGITVVDRSVEIAPTSMFAGDYVSGPGSTPNYALSPDGQRFLVIDESSRPSKRATLVAVENWFEELRRLAPWTD